MEVRDTFAPLLWLAAAALSAAALPEMSPEAGGESDRAIRSDVKWALKRALEKLERTSCRLLFSDFADTDGRVLQQHLENRSETAAELLRSLHFRDGSGQGPCRIGVLAFTTPGARTVFICGGRFREAIRRRPDLAANVLIHEELHILGLEEFPQFSRLTLKPNGDRSRPPTSAEINDRVAARCGD